MERRGLSCPMPVPATIRRRPGAWALLLAALCLAGCSSQVSSDQTASPQSPHTYVGFPNQSQVLYTLAIDHTTNPNTFVQYGYSPTNGYEQYVLTSGNFTPWASDSSILNIGVTYGQGTLGTGVTGGTIYSTTSGTIYSSPGQTGNWAIEWPGQGGFSWLQAQGQTVVVPFAPNQACPTSSTPANYQFVTFPNVGDGSGTAYGQVTVAASGSTIYFSKIARLNISGGAASDLSTTPPTMLPTSASATGTCGPTVYGQTISVPDTVTVTNPGGPHSTTTPSATIAIGATGFLVESNGYVPTQAGVVYQNILGAGFGAVGLPLPSGQLSTTGLVGAQYTGFIYPTGKSASYIASFGYSNQTANPVACPKFPATGPILFGGDFQNNDPSSDTESDFAINLGTPQDPNNSLYPNALICVGKGFLGNATGASYSFRAVAIAGQLQGKYAIFLVALDPTGTAQDWGIYLLQSN